MSCTISHPLVQIRNLEGDRNMEQSPNQFDGISTYLVDPAELSHLDSSVSYLLEPGQRAFFENYPASLDALIEKAADVAAVPNLARWLESLKGIPLALEIHATSDLYNLNAVWLRFHIQDRDREAGVHWWKPAINLLHFLNPNQVDVPDVLMQVYAITGEINHNGYMAAGRLRHPDRFGDEYTFYDVYSGDKAFYRASDLSVYWEFHGGYYEDQAERRKYGLYHFEDGMAAFLNTYFACLLDKKELCIEHDGSIS